MRRNPVQLLAVLVLAAAAAWGTGSFNANADFVDRPPGQNPDQILQRCIEHIHEHADGCIDANRQTADRAVASIERLLEEGDIRGARRVAAFAIGRVNDQSDECIEHLREICARCARRLEALNAHHHVLRLRTFCRRAINAVESSRDAAIARIRAAFD